MRGDVLQRVGVLSIRRKRHLKPLDLTRVVFSDEKFFRWNYTGQSKNSPIRVMGAHGRPPRKADLDPDVCINEDSQRNPVLHRRGCAHQHRMLHLELDDVCLPHCMARHGTDTSSWWWQEDNAPSHTSQRSKTFLKERESQLLTSPPCSPDLSHSIFTSGKSGKRHWESVSSSPNSNSRHDRAHNVRSRGNRR